MISITILLFTTYMIYCSVSIIINEMTKRKKQNRKARLPDKINGPQKGTYVKINFDAERKQRGKQRTQITYTNLK